MEKKTSTRQRQTRTMMIAWRLANADFLYSMNPRLTSGILGIDEKEAARARRNPVYAARIEELKSLEGKRIGADVEKLRLAMSGLIPRAIEELGAALDDSKAEVRIKAATEILDRDGRLPKVSRVQNEARDAASLPDVDMDIVKEFHKVN